jgi:hypothetical protein
MAATAFSSEQTDAEIYRESDLSVALSLEPRSATMQRTGRQSPSLFRAMWKKHYSKTAAPVTSLCAQIVVYSKFETEEPETIHPAQLVYDPENSVVICCRSTLAASALQYRWIAIRLTHRETGKEMYSERFSHVTSRFLTSPDLDKRPLLIERSVQFRDDETAVVRARMRVSSIESHIGHSLDSRDDFI